MATQTLHQSLHLQPSRAQPQGLPGRPFIRAWRHPDLLVFFDYYLHPYVDLSTYVHFCIYAVKQNFKENEEIY